MRKILAVFSPLAISQAGCAPAQPSTDIVAFPGSESPAPASAAGYTLDTPIEVIAADPHGAAVLNQDIPRLLGNPNYEMFKRMSLRSLASLSSGQLTEEMLAKLKTDLAALTGQPVTGP